MDNSQSKPKNYNYVSKLNHALTPKQLCPSYEIFLFNRTEASHDAAQACKPKHKHVFCRSHFDLHQKHGFNLLLMFRYEPMPSLSFFIFKKIIIQKSNEQLKRGLKHSLALYQVPWGSRFKRKRCKLLSGFNAPSACLLALFKNM